MDTSWAAQKTFSIAGNGTTRSQGVGPVTFELYNTKTECYDIITREKVASCSNSPFNLISVTGLRDDGCVINGTPSKLYFRNDLDILWNDKHQYKLKYIRNLPCTI